ncbi:MAG: hypothetical protein WC565_07625 [Parcubacteria group bacterium]
MSHYYTEYARMIVEKHGRAFLATLNAKDTEDLVGDDLSIFCPERQEIVGVALEVGAIVGDDAPPTNPRRKYGRDAMFR